MCARFLQTLGHLEKAVVLELTLKHVKALTSLLEQQQQKILALQNGMQIGERQVARARVHIHGYQMALQNVTALPGCKSVRRVNVSADASKCLRMEFVTVASRCVYRAASSQPGKV